MNGDLTDAWHQQLEAILLKWLKKNQPINPQQKRPTNL